MKKNGKSEYIIKPNEDIDILKDIAILEGKNSKYVLHKKRLYRCSYTWYGKY